MSHHQLSADHLAIIRQILAPYASQIELAGLFGSRATGRPRPNSDIDLVLYGPLDEATAARIWTLFDDSNLPITVDVVAYSHITHDGLKAHIDRVMVPLFSHAELQEPALSRQPN